VGLTDGSKSRISSSICPRYTIWCSIPAEKQKQARSRTASARTIARRSPISGSLVSEISAFQVMSSIKWLFSDAHKQKVRSSYHKRKIQQPFPHMPFSYSTRSSAWSTIQRQNVSHPVGSCGIVPCRSCIARILRIPGPRRSLRSARTVSTIRSATSCYRYIVPRPQTLSWTRNHGPASRLGPTRHDDSLIGAANPTGLWYSFDSRNGQSTVRRYSLPRPKNTNSSQIEFALLRTGL